jgi:hypothetical protein
MPLSSPRDHFQKREFGRRCQVTKTLQSSYSLLLVSILIISASVASEAQNREKFVISAKAGGVNAVTGRPTFHGKGTDEWQQLTIKEDLEAGDIVKTGFDGRVEMLLSPGSYLRVGEDSEFQLTDNSLEKLEVNLFRGTAIVEAGGSDDTELLINITTPHAKMAIVRRGLYRVNVVPGDATELIVRKGRVLLADSQTKVKGGSKVVFSGTSFSVAKLDKADKKKVDSLESWSKERANLMAQANRKITGRDLNLLMAGFNSQWWSRGFLSSSPGVWLFSHRYGCFTFVPFYFGWGSPYGGMYSNSFYGGWGTPSYSLGGGYRNGGGSPSSSSGGGTAGGPIRTAPPPPSPPVRNSDSSPGFGRKPDITPDGGSRPMPIRDPD